MWEGQQGPQQQWTQQQGPQQGPQGPQVGVRQRQPVPRWAVIGWSILIGLFVVGGLASLISSCTGNRTIGTLSLSDEPVSACDNVAPTFYSTAPGTLSAQVDGQPVTHFIIGQPFQLIYTGSSGDVLMNQQLSVDAYPYFDNSLQTVDGDSAAFAATASAGTLTATIQFPFVNPQHPNKYIKTGPYCFDAVVNYTRPDGEQDVGLAWLGLSADQSS